MTESSTNKRIYLSPPHLCGKEKEFVDDAFNSNWVAPLGPYVDRFEKELSEYLSAGYCAALSSGTAALHLALKLLDVQQDDFIICPSFTFSATANPILYEKAIPVFIDSELETWNMDPELLERGIQSCISNHKTPKAIIVVHLYGMPAKMDEIMSIANRYEIPVIEDAAESLGSVYKNKFTGTFGMLGVLSFNGNKIITTSGGGALISENRELVSKAKFLATQSREKALHYEHKEIGYNYRLSNISAAIGCGQMTVLNNRIEKRREIFQSYRDQLEKISEFQFFDEPDNSFSNRWLTTCLINSPGRTNVHLEIIRSLESHNIESRPLWKPLHLQPVFRDYPHFLSGVSENCFQNGICLPSGTALTNEQIDQICSIIRFVFSR